MTALGPERDLLGCLLLDSERIAAVAAVASASDIEDARYRAVFEAIVALHGRGAPVSFVTVLEELRSCSPADGELSATLLSELGQSVTSSAHAVHLAHLVAERAALRRAIRRVADWQIGRAHV